MNASATLSDLKNSGTVTTEELSKFYKSCQSFLIEAVTQIQNRFSLNDKIHDIMACIYPRNVSSLNLPSLAYLFEDLPQLAKYADKNAVDEEWRHHYLEEELSNHLHFTKYWNIVLNRKNVAGLPCFLNLATLISTLLSLPFSNASVERFF